MNIFVLRLLESKWPATVAMCVAAAAWITSPARGQAPAGADISNTAACDYSTPAGSESTFSNTVTTRVLPSWSVVLTPPGSVASPAFGFTSQPGDTTVARFQVANAGNAADSVAVSVSVVGPVGATVTSMVAFFDVNGNGRVDAGETSPGFLSLPPGGVTPLDVAVVASPGSAAGDAFIRVSARSTADTLLSSQASVFRVAVVRPPAVLHLGPSGNAMALPRGDGSPDDVSLRTASRGVTRVSFDNDVFNETVFSESVELMLPDTLRLPAGVAVTFVDTSGVLLAPPARPRGPRSAARANLGVVGGGENRRFRVVITSSGADLATALAGAFDFVVIARSAADTTRFNATVDRVDVAPVRPPPASIAIEQAFREPAVGSGDVATLIVTVRNLSDSANVDSVVVVEAADRVLDYRISPGFRWVGGMLRWPVGPLAAGESRSTVIKYVANNRVARGRARARGTAEGRGPGGEVVRALPAESLVRIENDVFDAEGFLFGDVFVDINANGVREAGEPGVPGVSVLIESGEIARTDTSGHFTIPRVFEGYRVVRLDESTLPPDLELLHAPDGAGVSRGDRHAPDARAGRRLVHLLPGGNARVEFPVRNRPEPKTKLRQVIRGQERTTVARRARLYSAFVLPSSHFALGRARLSAGADRDLTPIIAFLRDHPAWGVYLEGHTDSIPMHNEKFDSNDELSRARADAVGNFLRMHGVADSRIVARGWGERRPVATNESIEGRRLNRRVEISFIPPHVHLQRDGDDPVKVRGAVRDFSELPDTFVVRAVWELTTSSLEVSRFHFRVHVPPGIDATIRARHGAEWLQENKGAYSVDGFARGRPVELEVRWTGSASDTLRVEDIRVVLSLDGHPSGVRAPITLRPYMAGSSRRIPRAFDVVEWEEESTPSVRRGNTGHDAAPDHGRIRSLRSESGRGDRNGTTPGSPPAPIRPGFTAPNEGTVISSRDAVTVRARVPVGARTQLRVNEGDVAEDRIGMRVVTPASGFEEITWYGVPLVPAWNTLTITGRRVDGSKFTDTLRVARATAPRKIVAARERVRVPADGVSGARLRFDVLDAFDLPVADGVVVTVSEGESWLSTLDARPAERGLQVLTAGGRIELEVEPGRETGSMRVEVRHDGYRAQTDVIRVPAGRPVLATGIIDVGTGLYRASGDGDALGIEHFVDGTDSRARARAFVEGTTRSGINVTARIDTRKRDEDPLLKQTSPERQYPVYGDASEVHYAAPAQGGTFVSLEKDESYLRYGDFRTPFTRGEFLAYERATTGLSTELVRDQDRFSAFVAQTDFSTRRDELRADGTSGFYYLNRRPIVENSEKILVETRDRFRPEKIVDVHPMVRNRDYTINSVDGSILFKEPVASFDARFNPNTIVVYYEAETGTSDATLLGVRGETSRSNHFRAAAQAITADGDGDRYTLLGGDADVSSGGWHLGGEVARSDDPITGTGGAWKVQGGFGATAGRVQVYHRRVDGSFNNPSFRGSNHELATRKSGYEGEVRLSPALRFRSEGYAHRLYGTGELKETAVGELYWRHGRMAFVAGVRGAREQAAADSVTAVLALAGLRVGDPSRGEVSIDFEKNARKEWVDDYPDRIRSRASTVVTPDVKAVASHEYLTASGRPGSHQLTAGLEARAGRATDVYTRYSMSRLADDARTGAVTGVRHRLRIGENSTATLGAEGLLSLAGRDDEQFVSARAGIGTKVRGAYFVDAQYELRAQRARTRNVAKFDGAWQAASGIALLAQNVLTVSSVPSGRDELGYRGVVAAAFRPDTGRLHGLAMLRNGYARYAPSDPDAIRWRLIASTDLNVRTGPRGQVRLRYAFKHVEDYSFGVTTNTSSDLVLAQYVHGFAPKWDADVWGRRVSQRGGGSTRLGTGVEVGRTVAGTLRIAAGYALAGTEDPDFAGTSAWTRGFSVRAQLILSEWMLRRLWDTR